MEIPASSQKAAKAGRKGLIYTEEMIKNARHNVKTYDWAKKLVEEVRKPAQMFVDEVETLYDLLPVEGVPRSYRNATLKAQDDVKCHCPACGADADKLYGNYCFDPVKEPWKIWCPACNTRFPTNDFGLLYKRGLDEKGEYNRDLAVANNKAAVARGEKDALVNELYPEKGVHWMVDDGFGWSPTQGIYGTKDLVQYAPVAKYAHLFWTAGENYNMRIILSALRDCYLYTGQKQFGRAGLVLLDRVADLYPGFDVTKVSLNYHLPHGGGYSGKVVGSIQEYYTTEVFIRCFDAFSDLFDDPEVIAFLSRKAKVLGLQNPKTSGALIRKNMEDGILRAVIKGLQDADIYGNFGLHQKIAALVAVALDTQPETDEILSWMQRPSVKTTEMVIDPIFGGEYESRCSNSGGEMATKYVNEIDRDGFGGEISISYNNYWFKGAEIAAILKNYKAGTYDLYKNPKLLKMFDTFIRLTGGAGYSFLFGDGGNVGTGRLIRFPEEMIRGYKDLRDPRIAQIFYWYVDGKLDGAQIGVFSDVEALTQSIRADIAKYGEYKLESENLTGYGLAIVRGGDLRKEYETRYDTWMYYGRTLGSHAHLDMLQMGIDAYGFNFVPDLGNPEFKSLTANRHEWVRNTLSHNTVTVDGQSQLPAYTGTPLHFDSTDTVKLIDTECSDVYAQADIYRRTLVTVAVNEDVSYTLDFFRVKGGNRHTYSFHTQSHMGYTTDSLQLVPQVDENGNYVGTYAGADVPFGPDPNSTDTHFAANPMYTRGYTWLKNVNRGKTLGDAGIFQVDFAQTNFQTEMQVDATGLHMKYHALNDWKADSVDFVTGYAPRRKENACIPGLDYMFIQRKGENLDTLFTSLLEPYKNESYILKAEPWNAVAEDHAEGKDDAVKVIKVTFRNGRRDYVIYATNKDVTYTVTDNSVSFAFRGFIGVYSVDENGKPVFSYVNDGTLIGTETSVGAYTGSIVDFTKTLAADNHIVVAFDRMPEDLSTLAGRYIYVENDARCNGSYRILHARQAGEYVALSLGNCSLIESYINDYDLDAGFVYTIAQGQKFRIPVSGEYSN